MKNSKRLFILLILIVSVLTFSMLTVSAAVVSTVQTDTATDKIIQIDARYKQVSTNKVSWNGNGGKIGSKTTISTNIKKGAKIGKLPSMPKRSGYEFKGWYTKKTGGTKITKNTKVSKKITYYARWAKNSANTNIDSKLLGQWHTEVPKPGSIKDESDYFFQKDGTFSYIKKAYVGINPFKTIITGKYKVSNGKIYLTNLYDDDKRPYKDTVYEYQFGSDNAGVFLRIPGFKFDEPDYVDINYAAKFRKR